MQTEKQMTLKDWILTLVLLFIPIVGLVMLIIWATDKEILEIFLQRLT